MSEEELEIFDLLKREKLTKAEEAKVKSAAQTLLKRLRDARDTVLIREWYKHQQSQEQVRREIQVILHGTLPETYGNDLFDEKTDLIFQHLYCQAEWNQGVGAIAH
jgi:type I restriction enzyme R subunit